jgi:hypothetical protein
MMAFMRPIWDEIALRFNPLKNHKLFFIPWPLIPTARVTIEATMEIVRRQGRPAGGPDRVNAFPQIVGMLMQAGLESYALDFRRATGRPILRSNDNATCGRSPARPAAIVAHWYA